MAIKPDEAAVKLDPDHVEEVEAHIDRVLSNPQRCLEALKEIKETYYYYDIRIRKRISYLTGNEIKRRYYDAGWARVEISGGDDLTIQGDDRYVLTVRLYPALAVKVPVTG